MSTPAFDFEALRRLSVADRLQLVKDLWDSIAEDAPGDAFPISPEHSAELDRAWQSTRRIRMQPSLGSGFGQNSWNG